MNTKITNPWLICSLGALFYCYEYLLRIEPSVMVPDLMNHFTLSANQFGVVIGLYYLAYTPMQFFIGVILDLYKPRYVLSLAVLVCAMGNLLFAITDQLIIASLGRFLIGFGSAFAFVGALKLATEFLPRHTFAFFSGIVTSLGMLGGFAGTVLLTQILSFTSWRFTLLLTSVMGFILLPILWHTLQSERDTQSQSSKKFNYTEFKTQLLTLLSEWELWKIGIAGCLLFVSISVFAELWGITFIKEIFHLTPDQAAFANSLIFLGWLLGGPINGYLSGRIERKDIYLFFGGCLNTIIISLLVFCPIKSIFLLHLLLFFLGMSSSSQTLCFVLAREITHSRLVGTVLAFINVMVMLGGLLFQPLVGMLLHSLSSVVQPRTAFNLVFAFFPLAYLVGTVVAYGIKSKEEHQMASWSLLKSPKKV